MVKINCPKCGTELDALPKLIPKKWSNEKEVVLMMKCPACGFGQQQDMVKEQDSVNLPDPEIDLKIVQRILKVANIFLHNANTNEKAAIFTFTYFLVETLKESPISESTDEWGPEDEPSEEITDDRHATPK